MTLQDYINNLNKLYKLGNTTEHTFRGDLQQVLQSLVPDIIATNEPKRQACGAPDYILTRKEIPVGYIEAKNIGDKDLEGVKRTGNQEQFDRYKVSLNNLIFTDYLDFLFYQNGILVNRIAIGKVEGTKIIAIPENFNQFTNLIKDFCNRITQTIKSAKQLAQMMAGKARLLSNIIEKAIEEDIEKEEESTLKDQLKGFQEVLIHDIKPKEFADVYAQTITYGMFAARLHDSSLDTFTRQEAAELIPKTNPFLRKLFSYVAGVDIDDRIKWVVDNLAEVFLACNVAELLKDYGKQTQTEDAIIHFYETFLSEYDPALRKARGVWYTPQPVVNFIVRAVDDILKTEFGLTKGLADNSKTTIKVEQQGKKIEQEIHKVQILDPATGTGTFLAEVVKNIYTRFKGQQGIWSNYVEQHLIPRLNGFELLMASYAMAHLQLDLLLTNTGYIPSNTIKGQRHKIFLTNSLEEHHPDTGTLFANWLSQEANEANRIKRDTPVMVVLGNPPYSGESINKGEWIMKLMEDYKKEPEGKEKLKERNPKWINDDYVKFLRYAQHFIERNGSGVVAFINPHGFLDNPTFRGMRWNLLKTYDKIYTIDLHGNSKKKETAPDGSIDQNVFDIMQGVSINIFVKIGKKKKDELAKVFHYDLYGKRDFKYDFLNKNSLKTIPYVQLENKAPMYFMVQKEFSLESIYKKGFKVDELFPTNSVGIITAREDITITFSKKYLEEIIFDFKTNKIEVLKNKYQLPEDTRDWQIAYAISDLKNNIGKYVQIACKPFDIRNTYYTGTTKGFYSYPRLEVMSNLINKENLGLVVSKQAVQGFKHIFITNTICNLNLTGTAGKFGAGYTFPLYLYNDNTSGQLNFGEAERTPNLNMDIVKAIAQVLGLSFTTEKENTPNTFAPIDILDYIYAVLHSPSYREQYKEFLKIDFPRVPYPSSVDSFWALVRLGSELRGLHLLESEEVENYVTQYPITGTNLVQKPVYKDTKVYINDTQYFDNVPLVAWEFYIGGYQPAQKWLKDRKDRILDFEDILHYQKIIVALVETARIMEEIDKIL